MKYLLLLILCSCAAAPIEKITDQTEKPRDYSQLSQSEKDLIVISSFAIQDVSSDEIRRIADSGVLPIPDVMKKIALNKHSTADTLETIIDMPYFAFNLDWPCLIHVVNHRNATPEILNKIMELRYDFSPLGEFLVKSRAADMAFLSKMYELHYDEIDLLEHMIENPVITKAMLVKISKHKNEYIANQAKYKLSKLIIK